MLRPGVLLLGHHHAATEDADHRAVLLVTARLHGDYSAVRFRLGLSFVQHSRLAVDRVAVEGRRDVAQRLDLEVGDGPARDVRHGHAQQQRVDEVADHDVAAELGGGLGVVGVQVQRVVVHRDETE